MTRKPLAAMIMASMFLLWGCVKDVQQPVSEQEDLHEVVFHAGWDAETKTVLQEDGQVFWEPGDEISLFVGDGRNYKLTSTNTDPATKADFIGSIGESVGTPNFVAVYPYHPYSDVLPDGTIVMITPNSQVAQEGTFDSKSFVSVAVSDNDHLYFRNVCGGIKFSVANEGIEKITIKSNNGETIAGKLAFDLSSLDVNQNVWFAGCNPSSSFDITAPDDGTFRPGSYYYAVIPAMEYSMGFTISYYKGKEVATFADYSNITIKRSTFKRLYNKDEELQFKPVYDRKATLPTNLLPDGVDKTAITEAHFYVNSDKTTEITIGGTIEGYEPVYFEQEGSVVNYYTNGEVYMLTDASSMFEGWKSLKTLDLSTINTDNVYGFSQMFYGCNSLEELNLSSFNTENSMSFGNMFKDCVNLRELDVTNFDTSSATDMYAMFENCCSLTTLDVSHFNSSAVTNFARMFCGCTGLNSIDVRAFDTSSAENISEMFSGLYISDIDVSNFNISNLKSLGLWAVFSGCKYLKEIDLSSFDTRNVENLAYLFSGCTSLERVDISNFDLSNVLYIDGLFKSCHNLKEVKMPKSSTPKLVAMQYMFENCSSLEQIDLSSFDTRNVWNMHHMFGWCSRLKSLDLSNFNTENVRDMSFMFYGCRNLENLNLRSFDSSNLEQAYSMFYNTYKLTSLDLGDFNLDGVDINGAGWWMGDYARQCHIRCSNATKEALIASSSRLGSDKYIWYTDGSTLPIVSFEKEEGLYYSSDFSKDKTVRTVQLATEGAGIDIVLMGDAYSDRLIADGTYDRDMERAIDAIFAVEPYKSFKHLFNIYIVYAVSENEVIGKSTALGCFDLRPIGNDDWSWESYYACAAKNPGNKNPIILMHSDKPSDGAATGFISWTTGDYMNDPLRDDYHGGFSEAVAYILGQDDRFDYTVRHEFGHSFGFLMDEYVSTGEGFGGFDWEFCFAYGLWKNVDLVSDNSVKWAKFINDPRYAGTGIGVYEGAYLPTGMWRSSPNSIMNSTDCGFNAPSREAIYYRIHKLAYGKDWPYDYETFVQWDAPNIAADKAYFSARPAQLRTIATKSAKRPHLEMRDVVHPDGRKGKMIVMD